MFIVGIDIAKRSHMVRIIDSDGQTVCKPFPVRNSCSGYNALLGRLRKLTNHKSEFIFAMETTSHYWLALYTRLRKEGYRVVVLNPIQTSAMREMLMQDSKTDEIDPWSLRRRSGLGGTRPAACRRKNCWPCGSCAGTASISSIWAATSNERSQHCWIKCSPSSKPSLTAFSASLPSLF